MYWYLYIRTRSGFYLFIFVLSTIEQIDSYVYKWYVLQGGPKKMAHLRFYFIFMLLNMLITGHMTHHFEAPNQLVSLKTTLFFQSAYRK
jgi:hypothetical protein